MAVKHGLEDLLITDSLVWIRIDYIWSDATVSMLAYSDKARRAVLQPILQLQYKVQLGGCFVI